MEFRCRLGTAGGEILEGIYVAESEDRLRHELEEKGLYILSLQRRGAFLPGISLSRVRRRRISHQEFVVLIGIIVLRVVPAFSEFYGNFDRPLPLSTQIIVAISNVVVSNFWLILAL